MKNLRIALGLAATWMVGCSAASDAGSGGSSSGGSSSRGGSTATGGASSTGGTTGSGGQTSSGGSTSSGGVTSTGGSSSGGATSTGGTSSGGVTSTGGSSSGGSIGSGGADSTGGNGATGGQGAAGGQGGQVGMGGGSGGNPSCQKRQVKASEVLWVGDSWIEIPGSQHTTLRDLARTAGALGANEDYVDKAVSGSTIATIIQQYTTYEAGATKVKVLLMDGGGIDVMQQNKTQASVDGVVQKVKAHLAQVKTDGTVQHIIYYTYPQLPATGPGMDVGPMLQPGLQAACKASAVPCHYIYLEPLFMGHSDYIGGDSLHPSDAGAKVIANAIWKVMQDNCIAQ